LEVIDEIVAENVLGQDAAVDQTRSRESFRESARYRIATAQSTVISLA
jgi:hypothetical protein